MMGRRFTRRLRPCRIKGRRQCHLTSSSRQRPQSVRAVVRINSCLWWTITDIPRRATILRNVGRWRMGRNGIYLMMTRVRLFRTRCLEVIRILCGLSGSKAWRLDRCSKDNIVYDFTLCVIQERGYLTHRRSHLCHLCWSRLTIYRA